MRTTRLLRRLYPAYLTITLVALLAITLYATHAFKQFHIDRLQSGLASRALLIRNEIARLTEAERFDEVHRMCQQLGAQASTRITVLLDSGEVIGDSKQRPDLMDNRADRPEVMAALNGELGKAIRRNMAHVAVPLQGESDVVGVVTTAVPLTSIQNELKKIYSRIAVVTVIVAVLIAGVAMLVARHLGRPLERIRKGAERFADGDLTHRLPGSSTQELDSLAETMNQMASELKQRIDTATRQRNEREAILSSMVEGVLAVDTKNRILNMNRSAAELLGVDAERSLGRALEETIRSPQLQQLAVNVLLLQESLADEFSIFVGKERYLHVQGAGLRDAEGLLIGAVLVIYDVTEIKRLENVRRDFVANVSHELKTPITSIKGYVETLLDGAINDPEDAKRFLRIVANQSDRLNAIINDLLALSRVEQKAERADILLEENDIQPVLEAAIEDSAAKAAACGVEIQLNCAQQLRAHINPELLEQAVANLIDNACKYSSPGATVWVEGELSENEVIIRVQDEGCGIEEHHLPRLFERFYRVDKSRSRKLGGTGLGLAIVKHISQAHHGQIQVTSVPDEGTTFRIRLPMALSS